MSGKSRAILRPSPVVDFPWYVHPEDFGVPDFSDCLPACTTTLILYWREILQKSGGFLSWVVPQGFDKAYWKRNWSEVKEGCMASFRGTELEPLMDSSRNSEIPAILEKTGAGNDLAFETIPNANSALSTAATLAGSGLPSMVVVDVEKFYGHTPLPGPNSTSHLVIVMNVNAKGDWFQIYDPSKRYPRKWIKHDRDHMEEGLSAEHLLLMLRPKNVYSIQRIPFTQRLLVSEEGDTWD